MLKKIKHAKFYGEIEDATEEEPKHPNTLHKFQNDWIKICFATGFQQSTFNYYLYDKATNGRIYFSKWTMTEPLKKAGM